MKPMRLREFVELNVKEAVKRLGLLRKALEKHGFKVHQDLNDTVEPYLYVFPPNDDGRFGGLRLYQIGEDIAYRLQKEPETHPYGEAYRLPMNEIYDGIVADADGDDIENVGELVIEAVVKEIKLFFKRSYEYEKTPDRHDAMNARIVTRGAATGDYESAAGNMPSA